MIGFIWRCFTSRTKSVQVAASFVLYNLICVPDMPFL